jgi:uncharacterized protein YcsI (UPF0317 family)
VKTPYHSDPAGLRRQIRSGTWSAHTAGQARGYAQANLVVVPRDLAFDFLLYAQRNPRSCPVLEVLEPGNPAPLRTAPNADIRTDLPGYRIFEDGVLVSEKPDIMSHWRDDATAFLIGCSFTFEEALEQAGVPVRHLEIGSNVPMFRTSVDTVPAGVFRGKLVVSMRPIPGLLVGRAVEVTSRLAAVHGAPVHVGSPESLGIEDLSDPDYGDPVPVEAGEVPVFWACGVTPQSAVQDSRPPWFIGHSPGKMFVTDVENKHLEALSSEFWST